PPRSPLFPYTTLFRSRAAASANGLPGRFVRSLWPRIYVHGSDRAGHDRPLVRAAEQSATYGADETDSIHPPAQPDRSHSWAAPRSEEHTSELQSPYDL